MTTRSLLALSSLPMLLAGVALSAYAQTKAPADQPAAGKDKAAAEFMKADANKDGKLTKDEVSKMPAIAAKFDELDKDKDGALSAEEFSAGLKAN